MARKKPPMPQLLMRWGIVIGGGLALVFGAVFLYAFATVKIPDPNDFVNGQATIITYADGSEIGRIGAQNRISVQLAEIPVATRNAVLAAENKNFYTERAVSPTGILRAVLNNLRGGSLQGGSTITQQYAKTAFLTPSRTIQRKIKEIVIALKLEQQLSKDEILENYLNTIYFGRGSYGINTAAQAYFGVDVNQLTLSQSAVLASVLRSPGNYDPGLSKGNEERLVARWKYVLDQMVKSGWLTEAKEKSLKFPEIKPRSAGGRYAGTKGYIITAVQKELNRLGFDDAQLTAGGLKIQTTLEKKAQQSAVAAVEKLRPSKAPEDLMIGLVAIKPNDGAVIALYGGEDYLVRSLNAATQGITQAGSTFKPFALVAALEQGISLNSMWNGNSPQMFEDDIGRPYPVSNFGNESWGQISLYNATVHSANTVYVPLGIKVGTDKVVDAIRRAGIPESVKVDATPSVVLGPASPHVIDVANAFATFAAEGVRSQPYMVAQVQSRNGGVLYESRVQTERVFDADVISNLTYALEGVVQRGTGAAARALGRPAAGKTGTSQSNASAWFSAYTPQLAASVAMYRSDATKSLNGIGGINQVTGGSFPARIWTAFMKGALDGEPILDFPSPASFSPREPSPTATTSTPSPTTTTTAPKPTTTAPKPTTTSPKPTTTSPTPTPTTTTTTSKPTTTSPTPTKSP